MVGIGILMLGIGLLSLCARWKGKLYQWRWLQISRWPWGPPGFIAVLAGWFTTEVGPSALHGLRPDAHG